MQRKTRNLAPTSPAWLVGGIVLSIGIAAAGALGDEGGSGSHRSRSAEAVVMQEAVCGVTFAAEAAADTCLACLADPRACADLPRSLRAIDARVAAVERASAYLVLSDARGRPGSRPGEAGIDGIDGIDGSDRDADDPGRCRARWLEAERRLGECVLVALILPPEAAGSAPAQASRRDERESRRPVVRSAARPAAGAITP